MVDVTIDGSTRTPTSPSLRQYRALLSRYLKPQLGRVILMAVILLSGIATKLINPQVLRYFLDSAQAGGAVRSLYAAAGLFLAFAILQQGLSLAPQSRSPGGSCRCPPGQPGSAGSTAGRAGTGTAPPLRADGRSMVWARLANGFGDLPRPVQHLGG